jgi:hypothetical protein
VFSDPEQSGIASQSETSLSPHLLQLQIGMLMLVAIGGWNRETSSCYCHDRKLLPREHNQVRIYRQPQQTIPAGLAAAFVNLGNQIPKP